MADTISMNINVTIPIDQLKRDITLTELDNISALRLDLRGPKLWPMIDAMSELAKLSDDEALRENLTCAAELMMDVLLASGRLREAAPRRLEGPQRKVLVF